MTQKNGNDLCDGRTEVSGTSLVCHLLSLSGVYFGEKPIPGDGNNPLGIMSVRIFTTVIKNCIRSLHKNKGKISSKYFDLIHTIDIPATVIQSFKSQIEKIEMEHGLKAIKLIHLAQDPQLVCGEKDLLVFCFRHPNSVRKSMERVFPHHLSNEAEAAYFWFNHHLRFLQRMVVACAKCPTQVIWIRYERLLEFPQVMWTKVMNQLSNLRFPSEINKIIVQPRKKITDYSIANKQADLIWRWLCDQMDTPSPHWRQSAQELIKDMEILPITLENFALCKCGSRVTFRECCGKRLEEEEEKKS